MSTCYKYYQHRPRTSFLTFHVQPTFQYRLYTPTVIITFTTINSPSDQKPNTIYTVTHHYYYAPVLPRNRITSYLMQMSVLTMSVADWEGCVSVKGRHRQANLMYSYTWFQLQWTSFKVCKSLDIESSLLYMALHNGTHFNLVSPHGWWYALMCFWAFDVNWRGFLIFLHKTTPGCWVACIMNYSSWQQSLIGMVWTSTVPWSHLIFCTKRQID